MTRVISGRARGRRLRVPASATRPTSDRVREALFASVESRLLAAGRTWEQSAVCDLWAGSGALALEAWSRGSQRVLAVERVPAVVAVIEDNVATLGASGVQVRRGDVARVLSEAPSGGAFDVLFADPPYDDDSDHVRTCLESGLASGWFAPGALVVVERRAGDSNPLPAAVEMLDERRYGDTALWYGRVTDGQEEQSR